MPHRKSILPYTMPTLHVPRWRWPWPLRVLAACVVAWMCTMSVVWLLDDVPIVSWCMAFWEAVGLIDRNAPPGITRKLVMLTEAIDVAVHGLPGALAGLYTYHRLSFHRYRD